MLGIKEATSEKEEMKLAIESVKLMLQIPEENAWV